MSRTRRHFLYRGAAALAGTCLAVGGPPIATAKNGEANPKLQCLDYGRRTVLGKETTWSQVATC